MTELTYDPEHDGYYAKLERLARRAASLVSAGHEHLCLTGSRRQAKRVVMARYIYAGLLWDGGFSQVDIAGNLKQDKQTVHRQIKKLRKYVVASQEWGKAWSLANEWVKSRLDRERPV